MSGKPAPHIPQTEAEARALGIELTKRAEPLFKTFVGTVVRRDCATLNEGDLCLQTAPHADGSVTVCYCHGSSCDKCGDIRG